jgi:hypothetical protein
MIELQDSWEKLVQEVQLLPEDFIVEIVDYDFKKEDAPAPSKDENYRASRTLRWPKPKRLTIW